ncbi:glutamate-5-semialdehyde dehydrogenase [Pedobacter yulinensis]|uniref:Gamma-glutamyl phosphate reductase n=1 Tax=Pedobacter yulinensis TaxID=2126353 RepID=A0A2T3HQ84_9SPHI|nr:glutamate-5-semialdehyde dehydrogenase [Pedobacter yulinensis]PST84625.1 glutamate-5-semialdehyde dehydrogenase [Pedobacter yulinensis]
MTFDHYFKKAAAASRLTSAIGEAKRISVLEALADELRAGTDHILKQNQRDLDRMDTSDPRYDRLKLTEERIAGIAAEVLQVAALEDPLGRTLSRKTLPNGLDLLKVTVPLGVVGVIYEARPNVTVDVFSLCFKTGNVAVLKGGSDAACSNTALAGIIHDVLRKQGLPEDLAVLLPAEREATAALLQARQYVDVLIPRGSQQLIDYVRDNSRVPVIETGAGIVHAFFDESGDIRKGREIVTNSKMRRVSVCNALDCLLVHESRLADLPELLGGLALAGAGVFADGPAHAALTNTYPEHLLQEAAPEHFGTEFLSARLAVKTVRNLDEALEHIAEYSSKHSEAIISETPAHIDQFLQQVDAAAVYANASTAFTDGAQFGLGAEIGISTQKLHARGPMALQELTSYKWQIRGSGQIRS